VKNKEIECFVHRDLIEKLWDQAVVSKSIKSKKDHYSAKLIIEIPEKKIEITESDFDRAISLYGAHNLEVKTYSGLVKTLKKELGFTDD